MDSRRSQPQPHTDFVRQAETLIRSLDGVLHARIHAGHAGIDAIHVVAADDRAAAALAAHVRSALLAGLATPVVPARIHVRTGAAAPRPDDEARGHNGGSAPTGHPADRADLRRDRLRLVHGGEADGGAATAVAVPAARPADLDDDPLRATAATRTPVLRARLVAVDIRSPGDGRVVCRVSIAWNGQVHRADAIAVDLPGAAAQAAAQAAVRALAGAGLHGIELNGLREVEIAGKDYVVVALRRDDGPMVRHRSGSALMFGTAERSAAEAVVDAANELI
ncbi:MAG TPA: hypothetical protein VMM12_18330 [Longimicrobiales bacterium]|nr:hypothetical protein [Longimicrobiales bacterium]